MNNRQKQLVAASLLVLVVRGAALLAKAELQLNADRIAQAAGTKATTTKDGVVRIA